MSGPEDPSNPIPDDKSGPKRSSAEGMQAGGSSVAAGSRIRGEIFPNGRLALSFYAQQRVFLRRVEVESGLTEAEQLAQITAAMGAGGWHEMEWTEIAEEQIDGPLAPVVELPTVKRGWGRRWGQPSVRTLDMERDEPGLFAAFKARAASYWKFPFAKGDSD